MGIIKIDNTSVRPNDRFNVSKIETFLNSIIDNVVSRNTYVGSLPDTIDSNWEDMVLITVPASIIDKDAFADGTVLVGLYARPLTTGGKNVKKMGEMENTLNTVIENQNNSNYQISREAVYTKYDSNRNWHINIVELNIKIN